MYAKGAIAKKSGKSKRKKEKLEELERLEKCIFRDPSHLFEDGRVLFKKKRIADGSDDEGEGEEDLKPVWEDKDDDLSTSIKAAHEHEGKVQSVRPTDDYGSFLKRRFENISGKPKWAELKAKTLSDESDTSDNEDSVLRRCGKFVEKSKVLPSGELKFSTLKELNAETGKEGKIIKAVEFHPRSSVVLVAGLSGVTTLFDVDGKENKKIQMVRFPKFDVQCARFTCGGDQFIVGSKRYRHFYSYDMNSGRSVLIPVHHETGIFNMEKFEISPDDKIIAACGKYGNIFLISVKTKELVGTLKVNGGVNDINFSSDGTQLYSHSDDGTVYIWDVKSRKCVHKFRDDGCLKGTSISISPDDRLLACGSSSGVVNLYDRATVFNCDNPSPLKILLNLTTSATTLKFNHSSEILATASFKKDKAIRLMHYPSLSVYKNFPDSKKKLGAVNCVSFSPRSGYMALGTNFSRAFLFRLNYFGSY